MAASNKKIIAVVGSTGHQGGSLVRAILGAAGDNKSDEFAVRAVSRNVNSEKAQELAKLGAEVVQGDINNEASLTKAIEGAYGLYCVTLADDKEYTPELEIVQAKNMANAARNASIKHVIWSTMEDTRLKVPLDNKSIPTLYNKYKVPFYDAKAESDKFFADLPTTYLLLPTYWEIFTFLEMGPSKFLGRYYLALPTTAKKRLAGIGTEDIGKCALGIFKSPDEYIGKRVGIASEMLTLSEMAEKMTKSLGKTIHSYEMSFKEFRKLGFDGAEEFTNMFQYLHDFEADFNASRSVDLTRQLNPNVMNFDQWLAINKSNLRPPL